MQMIRVEQKRTERSGKSFVLMLLVFGCSMPAARQKRALEHAVASLSYSTRETDIKGWYKDGSVFGIVFTEVARGEAKLIADTLLKRVRGLLAEAFRQHERHVQISLEIFPQTCDGDHTNRLPGSTLPADLGGDRPGGRTDLEVKMTRIVDTIGSLFAIGGTADGLCWR